MLGDRMATPPPLPRAMPDFAEGFYFGDSFLWGAIYEDVRRPWQFESIREQQLTYRCVCSAPLSNAYGLDLASAEFSSNHKARPVMEVVFEISNGASQQEKDDRYFCDILAQRFGEPASAGVPPEPPLPRYGMEMRKFEPRYVVRWEGTEVNVGFSRYRSTKVVFGGRSIGQLHLRWEDVVRASSPYMAELLKEEQQIAQWLPQAEQIAKITLEMDQNRYGYSTNPAYPFDPMRMKSQICLRKADIVETPDSVRQQLSAADVLVWRAPKSSTWGISSQFDTLVFDHTFAQLEWVELLPAKGKGSSHLRIGNLSFRGPPRSPQLAALVATLRKMPNVLLNTIEEHDC